MNTQHDFPLYGCFIIVTAFWHFLWGCYFFKKNSLFIFSSDRGAYTGLFYAAWERYDEIVSALLQNGANVNYKSKTDNYTALIHASIKNKVKTVEIILHHKADINADDKTIRRSKAMYKEWFIEGDQWEQEYWAYKDGEMLQIIHDNKNGSHQETVYSIEYFLVHYKSRETEPFPEIIKFLSSLNA